MSFSTDAHLAYGIPLDEDWEPDEQYAEEWEDAQWVWGDKAKEQGFEVVSHCSGEYPMYFLAVPGTERRASRGYPEGIDLNDLLINLADVASFREAIKKRLGVDDNEKLAEEGWHLFSSMD